MDAYVYFYPLMSMDITRKQFTNVEPGKESLQGSDEHVRQRARISAGRFQGLSCAPTSIRLYSVSWLDMTKEPVVISAPDTDGRYYLLPMLDMWTDVFASPGWRTTGTKAGTFLITRPRLEAGSARKICRRVQTSKGHPADRSANALCLGDRPHQDRRPGGLRCGSQDPGRLQGQPAFRISARRRSRSRSRSTQAST